jgi:triphosphoribosyl-dephospho-CoA synthase
MWPSRKKNVAIREDDDVDAWSIELAALAVSSLVDTLELTPKPALVDRRGSGAKHDFDLPRMRISAAALSPGFTAIAVASRTAPRPSERLREQLGRIGREMERRMPATVDGARVHRGVIWSLGLLVAAAARRRNPNAVSVAAGAAALAVMPDRFAAEEPTAGDRARLRFGAAGARGEAQSAFPHVIRNGLPALERARARGASEEDARLDALVAIMSTLEDTGLLDRGGRAALNAAQDGARAVLDAGGASTRAGRERLNQLDAVLRRLSVAPRGSAGLLVATLFLDRFGNGASVVPMPDVGGVEDVEDSR